MEPEPFPEDSIPQDADKEDIKENNNGNETSNSAYLDNININKNNTDIKKDDTNIDFPKNTECSKYDVRSEISLINRYNNYLTKKESDDQVSKSSNSSEKKPDFNNNDCSTEEIQEVKPVIQHNIQRKRPVYTLPQSKKRSISQGKPFNLIHKYYDENFILEDDEEEEFKKYIKFNGDSRSDSKDNSRNSINSKSSLCNSNKKSLRNLEEPEEKAIKKNFDIKIEGNENEDKNKVNDENINISNINKRENEKNIFKKISEEFYNEDDESF